MRFAVLTDIHANREAFEAVLADVAVHGVDRIALLGDLVGYGADPEWCCDKAAALVAEGALCVRGNHDNAAAGAAEAMSTLPSGRSTGPVGRLNAAQKAFLGGLPMSAEAEGRALRPRLGERPAGVVLRHLGHQGDAVVPGLDRKGDPVRPCACPLAGQLRHWWRRAGTGVPAGVADPAVAKPEVAGGGGVVGQPRDGVAQAAWALVDTDKQELTFRRTPYDAAGDGAEGARGGLPEELAVTVAGGKMMQ